MNTIKIEVGKTYLTNTNARVEIIKRIKRPFFCFVGVVDSNTDPSMCNFQTVELFDEGGSPEYYSRVGFFLVNEFDSRKKYADWLNSLKIDDKITVRVGGFEEEEKRHFSGIVGCYICCYGCGLSSWTCNGRKSLRHEILHDDGTWIKVSDYWDLLK